MSSPTHKILVVDDDPTDYLLFKKKVESVAHMGEFEIEVVHTYKDGLEKIQNNAHDLYFIDYTLGMKSGLDLIEDATANGHAGPFIMLTGMDRPDLYQRSSETGVYDYILKNEVTPSQLQRVMTYTLERKANMDALKAEKEFSARIVREVPYMVINLDSHGIVQSVNPAVKDVTDYDDSDILDKNLWSLIKDEDKDIASNALLENSKKPFQTSLRCKDETYKTIEWTLLQNTQNRLNLSITGKDITAQLAEEEINRRNDKMQALGHLAGGVAHEINNLLQPILLNAECIKDADNFEDTAEGATHIITNTEVATSIVEDILIFARQDRQELEELNFIATFNDALHVATEMVSKDIAINVQNNLPSDDIKVLFRLKDLIRVLSNLIKNAAYAMDNKGDIVIKISLNEKKMIAIAVTDTGCGIPEDQIGLILNPFYTTKDIGQGTGLGLTMIYNLIKNWNGSMSIKSVEDKGTTMTFSIPVHSNI